MFLIVCTIDPALGRLDPFLMSEESLLETFFDGCTNKSDIRSANGIIDLSKFQIERKEDGKLQKLHGRHFHRGSVNFAFLPPSIEDLCLDFCKLSGSIMVEHWPASLKKISLSFNSLEGTINTKELPHQLKELDVQTNRLEGSFNTCTMPRSLVVVILTANNFSGTIDAAHLPENLESLCIGTNSFSGEIHFDERFPALRRLTLYENLFTKVSVDKIHSKLTELIISPNPLESCHLQGSPFTVLKSFVEGIEFDAEEYEFEWVVKARRKVPPE